MEVINLNCVMHKQSRLLSKNRYLLITLVACIQGCIGELVLAAKDYKGDIFFLFNSNYTVAAKLYSYQYNIFF